MTPQRVAQIPRRKNATDIVGVQKFIVKKPGRQLVYWRAVWSPRPNVVRKQTFSPRLYGAQRAKALAIQARNRGVRSMGASPESGKRRQGSRSREGKSPRSKL
jgi:hypothetical protein